MQNNHKGFTLIELLVSISIIAILTALLTANFIGARQRGRDGQRKAQVYNMQSALELYRADNNAYPPSIPNCDVSLVSGTTTYMQKIPCDPTSGAVYSYIATPQGCDNLSTDCTTYSIFVCLENEQDSDKDGTKNSVCPEASFTLTNP